MSNEGPSVATVFSLAGFVVGAIFGLSLSLVNSGQTVVVPYRQNDRVIVLSGFFAGKIGTLATRYVPRDGEIKFKIKFDEDGVYTDEHFTESQFRLVGDWNRAEYIKE